MRVRECYDWGNGISQSGVAGRKGTSKPSRHAPPGHFSYIPPTSHAPVVVVAHKVGPVAVGGVQRRVVGKRRPRSVGQAEIVRQFVDNDGHRGAPKRKQTTLRELPFCVCVCKTEEKGRERRGGGGDKSAFPHLLTTEQNTTTFPHETKTKKEHTCPGQPMLAIPSHPQTARRSLDDGNM